MLCNYSHSWPGRPSDSQPELFYSWPSRPSGSRPRLFLLLAKWALWLLARTFCFDASSIFFRWQMLVDCPGLFSCWLRCLPRSLLNRDCFSAVASRWSLQSHSLMAMHDGNYSMATTRWYGCKMVAARWWLDGMHDGKCSIAAARWYGCKMVAAWWWLDGMCADGTMANVRWLLLDDVLMGCARMVRWQMSNGCCLMMSWWDVRRWCADGTMANARRLLLDDVRSLSLLIRQSSLVGLGADLVACPGLSSINVMTWLLLGGRFSMVSAVWWIDEMRDGKCSMVCGLSFLIRQSSLAGLGASGTSQWTGLLSFRRLTFWNLKSI